MKTETLFAFLGGITVGAVAALLLAPEKGEATRTRIAEQLRERGINLNSEELDKVIDYLQEKLSNTLRHNTTEADTDSATIETAEDVE